MKREYKVFFFYLIALLIISITLSILKIGNIQVSLGKIQVPFNFRIIATIIGGIICLYLTIPKGLLKKILIVYCLLWLFRNLMLYIADHFNIINLFGKNYHISVIIRNYYGKVYLLEGPLPFILVWLIYYFISYMKKRDAATE